VSQRAIIQLFIPILLLAAGLGLIYFSWQPRGREETMAMGMVLVIFAVPFLLYAATHLRR
jgi:hypothetical protein